MKPSTSTTWNGRWNICSRDPRIAGYNIAHSLQVENFHMKIKLLGFIILFLSVLPARAETLVLVHGFLGSDRSWLESGVLEVLRRNGYTLAGIYSPSPLGVSFLPLGDAGHHNAVYTVNLPSTAPIALQAAWLAAYLEDLQQRLGQQSITLVGHSAGGVVARMALVQYQPAGVDRLITIAAPHLGTWRAYQALDAVDTDGPLGIVKRWEVKRRIGSPLYYTLKASRGVLQDLTPARPGSFLYWLNAQPHPDIQYVSIIRKEPQVIAGDRVVPGFSQDMRLIPAIDGKSQAYITPQVHLLSPQDGQVIVNLLAMSHQSGEQTLQ